MIHAPAVFVLNKIPMKRVIILSVISAALLSCGKSTDSRVAIDETGMIDIALLNDNKLYLQDCVYDMDIVPLDNNVIIGNVDGTIVTDENIIVYDARQTKSIFIFGRDGKHIKTIHRLGRGPQEYAEIWNVAMGPDNRSIAVLDNKSQKVVHFSLDGEFISSTPVGFWFLDMEYIDNDNIVCAAYGSGGPGLAERENNTDLLWFADKDFRPKSGALPARYMNDGIVITPKIQKFNNRTYVSRPYCDTIYQAVPGHLKAAYKLDMKKVNGSANFDPGVTSADIELIQSKHATFSGNFTDSDDHIYISVATPPDNIVKNYLYSKQSGKVYLLERDYNYEDELLFRLLTSPDTSAGNKFVNTLQPHYILLIGGEKLLLQHPELGRLTEEGNPVVVMYRIKEGL